MKFFSRNKESSDPTIIVRNCLQFLLNRITDEFDDDRYSWNKSWGVKHFESIILAKFIIDDSFERLVSDELSDEEKKGYYELSKISLFNIFNTEFSEVGVNFEDMKEQIEGKVKDYFSIQKEKDNLIEYYYQIYMLMTGSQSRYELEEEIDKKKTGVEIMRTNNNFAHLVAPYEAQISSLEKKIAAFNLAEIMIPHMYRSAKQKLKIINLKKIKSLSKALLKQDKKK